MSLAFEVGDIVHWTNPRNKKHSGIHTITQIVQTYTLLAENDGSEFEGYGQEMEHVDKLFGIYHQHEYGSTQCIIRSSIFPTEEQVIECLGIDFEPEKDEFIAIEEIEEINTLELS